MAGSPGDSFCNRCGAAMATGTLRFPSAGPGIRPPAVPQGPATLGAPATPAVPAVVPAGGGARKQSLGPVVTVGAAALLTLVFGFLEVWLAVVVLAAITFVVTYVWWESFADQLAGPAERFGKRMVDNLFSFARMVRVSTASWTRKGRAEVRVRSRQLQVRRRHEQALRALGHAVYKGDQSQVATARARAEQTEEELRRYEEELERARADADAHVERERAATDSTQEFR